MKSKALKWLTTVPVAIAVAVSLAACGGGSAQTTASPTDALQGSEGTLTVGTLSDAPPNIYIDQSGKFTGYDNELLRAIADKLGLKVEFKATGFASLLAQVQNKQFDLGSSSIS